MIRYYFYGENEISEGLGVFQEEMGFELSDKESADVAVEVIKVENGLSEVTLDGKTATVTYGGGKARFFRAFAHLHDYVVNGKKNEHLVEEPVFDMVGTMVDMSRNAVMNVETVQFMLRKMALMGMDSYMLYTEDTYEIEGREYFGYMRGRYTKDEIRQMDKYAIMLGIELIPCVQMLGHLKTHLHWPAAAPYRDTPHVLLVGADATYELIEDMLKSIKECFTSRRLHMGMDETVDLGTGAYVKKHGHRERTEIFLEHLNKVTELAKKHGFKPMMWSDMFFRLAGKDLENFVDYDRRVVMPESISKLVPEGIEPVFWDYYHPDVEFYSENIEKHKLLGKNTIFAGGIWGWSGYSIHFTRSLKNSVPALIACKDKGVKEVIATVWHNGSEASLILSLAGMSWYADYCYKGEFSEESAKECFRRSCGDFYDDIRSTEKIEYPHGSDIGVSRVLIYNDPLMGLLDKHIEGTDTRSYYLKLTEELKGIGANSGKFKPAFDVIYKYSDLAIEKADYGVRLKKAYDEKNNEELKALLAECDVILKKLREFKDTFRSAWLEYNKPFGLEVHDIRYGGVIARFETTKQRLNDYLDGKITRLEELEEVRLYIDGDHPEGTDKFGGMVLWHQYQTYATVNIL